MPTHPEPADTEPIDPRPAGPRAADPTDVVSGLREPRSAGSGRTDPDTTPGGDRILGAFPDPLDGRRAVEHLEALGFSPDRVRLDDEGDRRRLVDDEHQTDEAASTVLLTAGGLTTRSQTRGAIIGTVVGAALGLLGSIPFWLTPIDVPLGMRIVAWAAVGLLAGSTVGFVYGGARLPQLRGEHTDVGPGTTVSAEAHTDAEVALARSVLSEQARRRAAAHAERHDAGNARA